MILLKEFETVREKYETRIDALAEVIVHSEVELDELKSDREAILRDVMNDGDVSALDARIEASSKRIEALHSRIDYTADERNKQLSTLLDEVEEARTRAVAKKEKVLTEAINELNRKKVEFLTAAARIGELAQEVNLVNDQANTYRNQAGADELKHWKREGQMTLYADPRINGFDSAAWNILAIPDWLVKPALEGKLPSWAEEMLRDGK